MELFLQEYTEQLQRAKENGFRSTIRRKARRVQQIKSMIHDVTHGKAVDLANIPDPFLSPFKLHDEKELVSIEQLF